MNFWVPNNGSFFPSTPLIGVAPHIMDDGLSIIYYAGDTVLFMDHDMEYMQALAIHQSET
jgi:hypothetical protein